MDGHSLIELADLIKRVRKAKKLSLDEVTNMVNPSFPNFY